MDIYDFLSTNPNVIWLLVIIGSVAVIGLVDFCKNWVRKKATKWIVLLVSFGVAIVLSPITPQLVSTIIIMWLLILAVSTLARNAIVDGLPNIVAGFMKAMSVPPKLEDEILEAKQK
jgi:hypothetical protein